MLSNLLNIILGWPLLAKVIIITSWFASWYFVTSLRYLLTEADELDSWSDTFALFAQEVMCRLPGGEAHRFVYIERKMNETTEGDPLGDEYLIEEIQNKRLHEEVYFLMRGSHRFFWTREAVILLFGPIIVFLVLVVISIGFVLKVTERIRHPQQIRTRHTAH